MSIAELRRDYHARICREIVCIKRGRKGEYPNFADADNATSIAIARGIVDRIAMEIGISDVPAQTAGGRFEEFTRDFLERAFELLQHIRPGAWQYSTKRFISAFDQYAHLADLERAILASQQLSSSLGTDYIARPDIVIGRLPVSDMEINQHYDVLPGNESVARLTPLRSSNSSSPIPILHASISCKWTVRSDRAQNSRTEALNLIRNRKGPLPRIAAVTAEPLPTRLASLALGTGDLDCVYHFALDELREAIQDIKNDDQMDMLRTLIDGRRLRDISDLPFDLAI
ncbi:MAG TPA: restriction endonuclease [Chloroflexi bacterium]|jgi:hypothetical protein|nr:restriction endonuclease [Chloroflexota bacterium]